MINTLNHYTLKFLIALSLSAPAWAGNPLEDGVGGAKDMIMDIIQPLAVIALILTVIIAVSGRISMAAAGLFCLAIIIIFNAEAIVDMIKGWA